MEKLDNVTYQKLTYNRAKNRINDLFQNEELLKLGLTKKNIAITEYGYNLECISIGKGNNELFIVAGTHGSEIISIDFVTQLLEQINTFEEFDPTIFKINIIPIQNPEGFDISTSMLKSINDNTFEKSSYEYYLRYRTDNIITKALNELNLFLNELIHNNNIITATIFLNHFKNFINTNKAWQSLSDNKAIPNITIFNRLINSTPSQNNLQSLQLELINACNVTISKLNTNNLNDLFLITFIEQLKQGFSNSAIWNTISNENQIKLHQEMFKDSNLDNLQNPKLKTNIDNIYRLFNHPKGSQIIWDATGSGINLNANNKLSPGISAIKNKTIIYGPGAKNNIKNYFPGPLGIPTKDVKTFSYAIENKALFNLLNESYNKGTYRATLLYHGTGGLIYYKPYKSLMNEKEYDEYSSYNQELAAIYNKGPNYKILEEADTTGYGDLLRRTFPGVLLIELSKMGGNPIAPYGDQNNIYNTINDNFKGIKNILKYLQLQIINNNVKKK